MVTLFLTGVEVYAYHGVTPEEKKIGHRYLADLEIEVDCKADRTDRVEDTVDYGVLAVDLSEFLREKQVSTLERLAALAAEDLLKRYPKIQTVRLRLSKPFPPAPVIAESAGVEIERNR